MNLYFYLNDMQEKSRGEKDRLIAIFLFRYIHSRVICAQYSYPLLKISFAHSPRVYRHENQNNGRTHIPIGDQLARSCV